MSYEITREDAGELIDVAELLHETYGKVTESGIIIDQQTDGRSLEVAYSLPGAVDGPFRTLSTSAYAAEFYAVSDQTPLGELDFDGVAKYVAQCRYIGRWLAEPMLYQGMLNFDDIRALQTAPPKRETRSLAELAGTARCIDSRDGREIL